MSHFCQSPVSDTLANAVALSGNAEVMAYVWGGSSGPQSGQILELWSSKGSVRIAAEDRVAPSNWIVSYKIPARCLGMTFIGVKPGTTGQETANTLRVGIETAAVAQARCARFPNQKIVTPPAGRPSRITADLWLRLLNFAKQYEGITDFFYNDRSNPQLVTCGVERMVRDVAAAAALTAFFVNPDGHQPDADEIAEDYKAAAGLKRHDPPGNLFDFAAITILRMPWDKIVSLLGQAMGERVNTMLSMADFSAFETFPADAQLACASIAYGSWQYAVQAPLREAVRARDWARAAEVYRSPGWDVRKDAAHVALFRSAAGL